MLFALVLAVLGFLHGFKRGVRKSNEIYGLHTSDFILTSVSGWVVLTYKYSDPPQPDTFMDKCIGKDNNANLAPNMVTTIVSLRSPSAFVEQCQSQQSLAEDHSDKNVELIKLAEHHSDKNTEADDGEQEQACFAVPATADFWDVSLLGSAEPEDYATTTTATSAFGVLCAADNDERL